MIHERNHMKECDECGGSGGVFDPKTNGMVDCPECDGTGYKLDEVEN